MSKKLLCLALVLVMVLGLSVNAFAASGVSVVIDGEPVDFDSDSGEPFVDANGRTQVPLRAVMEQFGCKVDWDSATNTAIVTKGSTQVLVTIGASYITVNGSRVYMDTAAVNVGGHTYLPIRYVLEAFGAEVDWEDGKVSVRSPEPAGGSGIDNIYINSDGELIFKLSNGSTINAGVVKADNVSVKDAYVSGSGDLIITLSDGTSINAGSVRTGGSFSGLSFADYSVGTKFYIAQPSGSFTTKLRYNGTDYSIAFSSIYYELTAKNSGGDAWAYGNGSTYYVPYEVTVNISGKADAALAGKTINVGLRGGNAAITWGYSGIIGSDGSFSIELTQGVDTTNTWYEPVELYFSAVYLDNSSSSVPGTDVSTLVAPFVGKWQNPLDPENDYIELKADGTLYSGGKTYDPKDVSYSAGGSNLYARIDSGNISFYSDRNTCYSSSTHIYYAREGSWEAIEIDSVEDFMAYYETGSEVDISYDVFGNITQIRYDIGFYLKDEIADRLFSDFERDSEVSLRYNSFTGWYDYTVDEAAGTITFDGVNIDEIDDARLSEVTSSGTTFIQTDFGYVDTLTGTYNHDVFFEGLMAQGTLILTK